MLNIKKLMIIIQIWHHKKAKKANIKNRHFHKNKKLRKIMISLIMVSLIIYIIKKNLKIKKNK